MENNSLTAAELVRTEQDYALWEREHGDEGEHLLSTKLLKQIPRLLAAVQEKDDLIDGYKQVVASMRRNSKLIAVALFGDEAPEQPSLCDVVCYVESEFASLRAANAELENQVALQKLRVASLLFSGAFDNFTAGQIHEWVNEYEDAKARVAELQERLLTAETEAELATRLQAEHYDRGQEIASLRQSLAAAENERDEVRARLERYERWKGLIDAAPSLECEVVAVERFLQTEAIQPIIQAWKDKVGEIESRLDEAEQRAREFFNTSTVEIIEEGIEAGWRFPSPGLIPAQQERQRICEYLESAGFIEAHPEYNYFRWVKEEVGK